MSSEPQSVPRLSGKRKPKASAQRIEAHYRMSAEGKVWLCNLCDQTGESASDLVWEGLALVAKSRKLKLPPQPPRS